MLYILTDPYLSESFFVYNDLLLESNLIKHVLK